MAAVEPVRHQWSVVDDYRMAEVGLPEAEARVELLEGEVVEMAPMGSRHAACVKRLNAHLTERLRGRAVVSVQDPFRLSDFSEPQPDLAVLRPEPSFYGDIERLGSSGTVTPEAFADVELAVAEILT